MNPKIYDFAIIGGDMRQIYMANDLIQRKHSVVTYGLNDSLLCPFCNRAINLKGALESANYIICPIPFTKDGDSILSQITLPDLSMEHFLDLLNTNHKLYGGCIPDKITKHCEDHNIYYFDFMLNEEATLFNTIATAEGTIAEAITMGKTNLHSSSCLILGYGRCAKSLADRLRGLYADVSIVARSKEALASANTCGFHTLEFSDLINKINHFDYIFNTIPALMLTEDLLKEVKKEVVIIDISSAPGGVDFDYTKAHNICAKLSLGLPGKYSPKSSATYLVDLLLSNIRKK